MIGELNYGGKIIYPEDKEIMRLAVKHFVSNGVLLSHTVSSVVGS